MSELGKFVIWLAEFVEQPIDPLLIEKADQKDLPVRDLLELGRWTIITAVTAKIEELLQAR